MDNAKVIRNWVLKKSQYFSKYRNFNEKLTLNSFQKQGKTVQNSDQYNISERWRGVEQSLSKEAHILDIWRAWGHIQSEVSKCFKK